MIQQTPGPLQNLGRLLITAVAVSVGLLILADTFVSQPNFSLGSIAFRQGLGGASAFLISTTAIIVTFALFLGFFNVVTVHWYRVRTGQPGTIYSVALLAALVITLILGSGGPASVSSQFVFSHILQPLESTFFALLALFMATAAFRAFRVRNLESFFFVLFALIVLLGQIPISIYLWAELPIVKDWILTVPTLAGVRGILLGVALGTVATGLRVLLGIDRPYAES